MLLTKPDSYKNPLASNLINFKIVFYKKLLHFTAYKKLYKNIFPIIGRGETGRWSLIFCLWSHLWIGTTLAIFDKSWLNTEK